MKNLRFGILGLSDGNGHPYSWSAICNGYDPEHMKDCGFPVIPEYLAQQEWPASALPNVNVTHVWTQDPDVSARIADASKIQNVVTSRDDMIGDVDAVLLARDDAGSHFDLARPFLEAGLPVYIDKPIALTSGDLERLSQAQVFQDQIFSCSALVNADELKLTEDQMVSIGDIKYVDACIPKYWATYAVHIIEPVLALLDGKKRNLKAQPVTFTNAGLRSLTCIAEDSTVVRFTTLGDDVVGGLTIRVFGSEGHLELSFKDTFSAFRKTLSEFASVVRGGSNTKTVEYNAPIVGLIEAGMTK